MDDATLMRIAILPLADRLAAIDDLVDALVRRGLTEADVDRLERQVHRVNAAVDAWGRPH